ncbi:MAG: cupredoxin domain-containing protein [Chloroflexota bacterium]|nr:cupredoxin domain-containing protein [Chloroflexota bacterium]
MIWTKGGLAGAAVAAVALLAACASSGAGGRAVQIAQKDSGCTPTTVQATPGEKLKLVVKNESNKDYEIEGIDGTKLEELIIPSGLTRTPGYTVPDGPGIHKLKCYVPAGVSTIIEIHAGDAAATAPATAAGVTGISTVAAPAGTVVTATLVDYTITPDRTDVPAGTVTFVAKNASPDHAHELAVLRAKGGGSFEKLGEIEALAPNQSGEMTLRLTPGKYILACLIVPGEAGSTVGHFKLGMETAFRVGP